MATAPQKKRILQIGYNESRLYERAMLLREHGYDVQSVLGNQVAIDVLRSWPRYDLFILGHAAPDEVRLAMVKWLSTNYPRQPILVLNPSGAEQLDELPFNAPADAPEIWIPMIAAAVGTE